MNINIYISAKKIDSNYELAVKEYLKRLQRFAKVTIRKNQDIKKAAETCSSDAKSRNILIVPGIMSPSSPELAEKIAELACSGYSTLNFFLGDSGQNEVHSFHDILSLSGFQLSSGLTTVVITEQIYRAFCILNHITYHK